MPSENERREPALPAGVSYFLLLLLVCGSALAKDSPKADGPANAASKNVYDEAMRILTSIQSTKYEHETDIDEKEGRYYCDCSEFVGYVLNRTVAKGQYKGPFHDGYWRPVAAEYERQFEAAPAKPNRSTFWQQVTRLEDARPGDVIAWRLAQPQPDDTGHVVIVAARPVVEKDGLVKVVVIDSTTQPQVDDTRAAGTSGIGRGTMWFTVDKDGRPNGYIRDSRTATPKNDAVAIGRALPADGKTPATRRAA
jgi:hypothetical protein